MKNEVGIGISRNVPNVQGYIKIKCPVCGVDIIPIKPKQSASAGLAATLGITNRVYEYAMSEQEQRDSGFYGKDWEQLTIDHIKNHSAEDITKRIYKLEDDATTCRATAESLNDFLDEATGNIQLLNNRQCKDILSKYVELHGDNFFPEQIKELLYPSSLEEKADCF